MPTSRNNRYKVSVKTVELAGPSRNKTCLCNYFFQSFLYPHSLLPYEGTSLLSPCVDMVLHHCRGVLSLMQGCLCLCDIMRLQYSVVELRSRVYNVYSCIHLPKPRHVIGLISAGYVSLSLRGLDAATVFMIPFSDQGFVIF